MTWHLTSTPYRQFRRNPLEAVVAQLRFHPILKIEARVADFQDRVRARFPAFLSASVQTVQFSTTEITVAEEPQFQFRKLTEPTALVLTRESLAVETKRHESRETLRGDVELAVGALLEAYQPVAPVRFGLRYINAIQRKRIGDDLGRSIPWAALVAERFLQVPTGLADLEDTAFSCEVKSLLMDGGLTVRYGLLPAPDSTELHFRLDFDRFIEAGLDAAAVPAKVKGFCDDIFDLFMAAAGPDLIEWMNHA